MGTWATWAHRDGAAAGAHSRTAGPSGPDAEWEGRAARTTATRADGNIGYLSM